MPTIDVDYMEFERLLGKSFHGDMEKLDDALSFVKGEVKLYNRNEDVVSIEIKDTNRPDLWGVEGLARALKGYLNIRKGIMEYGVGEIAIDVHVDSELKTIRPFIGCSIIKNVKLNDTIIRGLMRMQDKLDQTYGRCRQKTSIGIYDFDLISPPLHYTVTKPTETNFVPLGFAEKMNLAEILERHPKGLEYGHIVKKHSVYPILLDSKQKVLSFPPVINSNDLGRVTEETRNLLVEVTGTLEETVLNTVKLVTLALVDRGAKAFAASIHYPNLKQSVVTPDFRSRKVSLNTEYTNKILGLGLTSEQIASLLLTAGLGIANVHESAVEVLVPCYRIDVMHPVDIVEDVAIAYGYNNIEPLWRELPTTGGARPEQRLIDIARELMVGLGFQEILSYTMTNPENLFTRMNLDKARIIEIANPKVVTMTCLRKSLLPGLIEFFSLNQSVEFPQKIFELGTVSTFDDASETKTRDETWLTAATSHPNANFSEIKSYLDSFFMNFGAAWQIRPTKHPSFIEGRTGAIMLSNQRIGVIGEINPQVLEAWKLENPTAAFEISNQEIFKAKGQIKPTA
jgi:phenylalanyl-tRNA synthetase beta chain